MLEPFNENALRSALALLSTDAQLAFGLSCCERMFPNYLAFYRESGWGEPMALREALDLLWSVLGGAKPNSGTVATIRQRVQAAEPDTENFESSFVSAALDAAAGVGILLSLVADGANPAKVVEIAALCRDTVDMFVQDLEDMAPRDPGIEQRILQHPLMQAELRRQHDDQLALNSFSAIPAEVDRLRQKWRNQPRGNLDSAV